MTASIADTLAILEALVGFDTTSRNSNLELIAWVESYLAGHGVTGERTYDPTGQKASVFATIGPKDSRAMCCPATPMSCPWMGRSGAPIRSGSR
jgi:acetylornithine deacetylase/succinyl-diaminopimelate desuccinylase-like protein